ncbi:hypothetical protein HDU76_006442 [Blyttiomyces sp. JEL0837]|nr:hypothetical protein HDU76_006442 [Blyttiomyces sp. JEL0837]
MTIAATNPHTESLDKALTYIKQLYNNPSEFTPHTTIHNAKISNKDIPGEPMPITKGEMTYPGKFSRDDILITLRAVDARKIWDSRFDDYELVEEYEPGNRMCGLIHSYQKGQWPVVSGRDFLVAFKIYHEGDVTWFIQTSVADSRFDAPVKGRVRANLTAAGWIIKPSTTSPGDWDVTYITAVNPGGTLPAALARLVSNETPACAGTVLRYLEQHGVPPMP